MNQPIHILNQLGILTSFSVAKKVTEEDIHKFFLQHKKIGKSEEEISDMLNKKILMEIHEAIEKNTIPGLISPQELASSMGIDKNIVEKIPELNKLILVIVNNVIERKYDKMSLCFFINTLVNMLGLTEEDFLKFHKQNHTTDDEEDESNDGDNDGDEED